MKTLQLTLFVIANVIFITQTGRHVHQLVFGTRPSVLDQFSPEKERAQAEKQMAVLVTEYRSALEETRTLEKEKTPNEIANLRRAQRSLYERRDALRTELQERERRQRELRDLWLFSGFALLLITVGTVLYISSITWPGFSVLVTGFAILEYWSSPTYFGGGVAEFQALLIGKIILTVTSLIALYTFWNLRERPNQAPEPTPGSVTPRAP